MLLSPSWATFALASTSASVIHAAGSQAGLGLLENVVYHDLAISPDGACGNGVTCTGSEWGQCCSRNGWCGNDDAYCGDGCNTAFGVCGPLAVQSSSSSAPSPSICPSVYGPTTTIIMGETCRITVTATKWETLASDDGSGGRAKTVTVTVGGGGRTTGGDVTTRTTTSTVLETHVVTITAALCTNGFGGIGGSVTGITPAVTRNTASGRTTIYAKPAAETPVNLLPGFITNCKKWYEVQDGEDCKKVAQKNSIKVKELQSWNPALTPRGSQVPAALCEGHTIGKRDVESICRVPCDELWVGYSVCVRV